jgi:uncharacterized protein YbjT (DUF2867 family)
MTNSDKLILVAGVTGQQGGAAARHLLGRGFAVRGLTRHPQKPAARNLVAAGAEVFEGDLNDRSSVDDALRGCYGVFSVQTFHEEGLDAEVRQGNTLADAAAAAGVAHFVYSSVGSADRDTGIPHFETKWRIEQHIAALRLPATIIRPVFFMDNFAAPELRAAILGGRLSMPLPPQRTLQMIAVDDIGAFAALAMDDPRGWIGRKIDIAGDELTMEQVVGLFGEAIGKPVRYAETPIESLRRTNREWAMMFDWFNDVGYSANIAECRRLLPGLKSFGVWLYETHWERAGQEAQSEL